MPEGLTILIVARNAEATIERAVASCLLEEHVPIVLVDDQCTDTTIERARALGGRRLRVIPTLYPGGVAVARQVALDAVETEFAAWLDADDEWIPGRASRLERRLRDGLDVVSDAIELHDGVTGAWLRTLEVPSFIRRQGGVVRLFERNFLPGDTQVAFRTSVFQSVGGYDSALYGPESFDILLRAVRDSARFGYVDEVGYRMYAYPGSVSRNLPRQRAALRAALLKHDYETVERLYARSGYEGRIAAWALVVLAQYRGEPCAALSYLEAASPIDGSSRQVLEPEGPWPFTEGWRRVFHRGTILLMLGGHEAEAVAELTRAECIEPTAEGANNLGVGFSRLGRRDAAREAFSLALARRHGYVDAAGNLDAKGDWRITTHPLRREGARMDYALPFSGDSRSLAS